MSDEDKKIPCKYGTDCYQKNEAHHKKYKHPKIERPSKRQKLDKEYNEVTSKENNGKSPEHSVSEIDKEELSSLLQVQESKETTLLTLDDKKCFIKEKFLVDMPEDFYSFWELCKEISPQKPKEAFNSIGLVLIGPFDILSDNVKICNTADEKYLLHWRYYFDPPEFQTVIKGDDKTGFHIGYFRDSPDNVPAFVAENCANENCIITPIGKNLFGAMNTYFEKIKKKADPFKKMNIEKLHKKLCAKAKDLRVDLSKATSSRRTVCKTFHTAGIVVSYDRKTQVGYRTLPVTEKELRDILAKVEKGVANKVDSAFSPLQPVLTAATIANDECDFGTGLELGINIFCFGSECLDPTALRLLSTSYSLLQRDAFSKIIEAHLTSREKGKPFVINFE